MQDVLLLNADFSPVRILDWKRAVCLLMDDKARLVAPYRDREIRSRNLTIPWPAVVTLRDYASHRGRVRFNRLNVLARDAYTCQYCGHAPRSGDDRPIKGVLTLDHVVPRCRSVGGKVRVPWNDQRVPVTSWQNVVTACRACNQRKADKTPAQAGLVLKERPRRPTPYEGVQMVFGRVRVPQEWHDYLPGVAA